MTNPMESELIRLRALEPEDVNILYKWENDTEIWKVSNTVAPFSKHMLRQFIENQQRDIYETRQLRLIIESKADGKPVGAIDPVRPRPVQLPGGGRHSDLRPARPEAGLQPLMRCRS